MSNIRRGGTEIRSEMGVQGAKPPAGVRGVPRSFPLYEHIRGAGGEAPCRSTGCPPFFSFV